MNQEEKVIWDELSEASNATILVNAKTPHKPSTHVNFRYVALGDLIKASFHQFYFGDTPNVPPKNDRIDEDHHTDNDGDTPIILTKLSKRDKVSPSGIIKVLSNPNPYYKEGMKELTIDGNYIVRLTLHLSSCPPTTAHIDNHWLTGC